MGPRLTVLETAMKRLSVCIALIACLSPLAAQADRITTMTREEKCVYVARLQVAAAFYYTKGQRRDEVKIHWHGDETANEREFVTRTIKKVLDEETTPLLPAELEVTGERSARLMLHEGRYHQVRRMFAAIGNHVLTLHRDRIGALDLPADLGVGAYRIMTQEDVAQVFASSGK